jgi:hypothetical protein
VLVSSWARAVERMLQMSSHRLGDVGPGWSGAYPRSAYAPRPRRAGDERALR